MAAQGATILLWNQTKHPGAFLKLVAVQGLCKDVCSHVLGWDKDQVTDFDLYTGTVKFNNKNVIWTPIHQWKYCNNRTVHFNETLTEGTNSELSQSSRESNPDEDTAQVKDLLRWAETTVMSAIQKLSSQAGTPDLTDSPLPKASPLLGKSKLSTTEVSQTATPPISKGKAPAPPPTRTSTSSSSQISYETSSLWRRCWILTNSLFQVVRCLWSRRKSHLCQTTQQVCVEHSTKQILDWLPNQQGNPTRNLNRPSPVCSPSYQFWPIYQKSKIQ